MKWKDVPKKSTWTKKEKEKKKHILPVDSHYFLTWKLMHLPLASVLLLAGETIQALLCRGGEEEEEEEEENLDTSKKA